MSEAYVMRSAAVAATAPASEGLVGYLRSVTCAPPYSVERFHAVFLCARRTYLGDASVGYGNRATLSLRMRDLFTKALELQARALIIAHNHPSGICRPSDKDICATRRLTEIAGALDIEVLDHLIITQSSVYSMRAGGHL